MKDKIRLDLSNDEKLLIIKSLNEMRNYLSSQDRVTDFIDEIILKVNDSNKLEVDVVDMKIIINSLNNLRCIIKNRNQSPSSVINILSKLIGKIETKNIISKKENERC